MSRPGGSLTYDWLTEALRVHILCMAFLCLVVPSLILSIFRRFAIRWSLVLNWHVQAGGS